MRKSILCIATLLLCSGLFALVGCGTNGTNCSSGMVYSTQYGCLTQGSCPSGTGTYNGTCVSLSGQAIAGTCSYAGYTYSPTVAMCCPNGVNPPSAAYATQYGCMAATGGVATNSCSYAGYTYSPTVAMCCPNGVNPPSAAYATQYGCMAATGGIGVGVGVTSCSYAGYTYSPTVAMCCPNGVNPPSAAYATQYGCMAAGGSYGVGTYPGTGYGTSCTYPYVMTAYGCVLY